MFCRPQMLMNQRVQPEQQFFNFTLNFVNQNLICFLYEEEGIFILSIPKCQ